MGSKMKSDKYDEVNEYRFELKLVGLGTNADMALKWAIEQLHNLNTEVVDGEIVYEEIEKTYDSREFDEQEEILVKPDEWLSVIPEA